MGGKPRKKARRIPREIIITKMIELVSIIDMNRAEDAKFFEMVRSTNE